MRFSVKAAVALVAALLLGASLLLAGLAWRVMERASATMNILLIDRIEALEDLSAVHSLLQININTLIVAASGEGQGHEMHRIQIPELIQRFAKNRAEIDRHLLRYGKSHTTIEENQLIALFNTLRGQWLDEAQSLLQQAGQAGRIDHRILDEFMLVRARFALPALGALDELIRLQVRVAHQEAVKARAEYDALRQKGLWLLIGAFLAGVLSLVAIGRGISRPLSALRQMLSDFSAGRTDARIGSHKTYLAEFERLGQEVNAMADAVVDQQSQMAATLASMDAGVMQIDSSGRILRINDAMARMTGAQALDMIGQSLSTLFAKGAGPSHMGEFVRRSHRRYDWLSLRSPDQFRQVLEAAPLGVLRIDAEGIIRLANPAAAHWFAGAAGQIEGRQIKDFIPFDDGASFAGTLARGVSDRVLPVSCLDGQRRKTVLGLQPIANGEALLWMMDAAHITWSALNASAFGCFLVEEEEEEEEEEVLTRLLAGMGRKLDRLALRNPEALFDMLNDAPLACLQVGPGGVIRYANTQAHQLAGFAPGTLAGMPLSLLIPQTARGGHDAQVNAFQQSPAARRMGEGRTLRMATQSGREIEVEVGLINHETAGERRTFAFLRSEMDLPWSVISSTSFGRLFEEEEEEEEEEAVLWLRGARGRSTPVQVSVGVVREGPHAGGLAVVNVTDISLLMRKTREAESQRDLLARVQIAMHDGLVLIDRNGNITEANPRALDILGCSLEHALESRIGQFFAEEEEEEEEEVMRWMPALHGTGLQRLYATDPNRFWISLWNMAKPLVVFGEGGRIVFSNPAAERTLNADPGRLIGRTCKDMIDEGDQSVMNDLLYAKLHHDSFSDTNLPDIIWKAGDAWLSQKIKLCPVQTLEAPMVVCCMGDDDLSMKETALMTRSKDAERHIIRADGRRLSVALSGAPLRDAQGHITGAVITLKDISELSAMKERESLQKQLARQEKLGSLGQLAAGVAHDFNNLLGAIQGHTELVKAKAAKGMAVDNNIQAILKSLTRAKDLVSRLQMLHREKDVTDTYFDLVSMLHEARVLLDASLRGIDLRIEIEGADRPCIVRGSEGEFQQVIVNLCVNAGHALKDSHDGRIVVALTRQVGQVHLSVEDNGCGIPPENLSHIFEPFFTTREVGEGTGLGLAMVHGIVQRMGGTIECESTIGAGTRFTMTFPVSSEENPATATMSTES